MTFIKSLLQNKSSSSSLISSLQHRVAWGPKFGGMSQTDGKEQHELQKHKMQRTN